MTVRTQPQQAWVCHSETAKSGIHRHERARFAVSLRSTKPQAERVLRAD